MREGRSERLRDALTAWEDTRGRALVVFAGSDQGANIKHIDHQDVDVVRRLLRNLHAPADIDLLIAGPGGNVSAAGRAAHLVQRSARALSVLVPYRARSATTLLALPADEIIFGSGGELGPLDAVMLSATPSSMNGSSTAHPPAISSRDVAAFPRMAADWFGISSQDSMACFEQLCTRMFPTNLSQLYRAEQHHRWVAQNLMPQAGSRPLAQHQALVEQLVSGYHSHDTAIDSREAIRIGLPARDASHTEEALLDSIWNVLDAEFASTATTLMPGASAAIVTTRHEIARFGLDPATCMDERTMGEYPVARWMIEKWTD